MRNLRRMAWAAAVAAATAAPGFAQQPGGTGGSGTTGGTTGTTGTTGTGGSTTGGTGSTGSTGALGGTPLSTFEAAPVLAGVSAFTTTTTGTTAVSPSNIFRNTLANPYYQGRVGATTNQAPGGFGVPLYSTTTGTTGAGAGMAGATGAGALGRAGTAGARGGLTANPGGVLVQLPRQIAYPAQLRFPAPAVVPVQIQADLRGIIDRTPMLANPAGVQVQVDGNTVVLRGAVRDDDEARLVEGIVRLTPGVRAIKNELTYPRP